MGAFRALQPSVTTHGVTPANAAIAPSTTPPRILDRSERRNGFFVLSGIEHGGASVLNMVARRRAAAGVRCASPIGFSLCGLKTLSSEKCCGRDGASRWREGATVSFMLETYSSCTLCN